MKKFFQLLSVTLLLLFSAKAQNQSMPNFGLNDSAYVKFVAENLVDTVTIDPYYFIFVPYRGFERKIMKITKPGEYYLSFGVCRPVMIYMHSSENFQALIVPGDTIEINIRYEKGDNKKQKPHFEAQGPIQQYFQEKINRLGYISLRDESDLKIKSLPSQGMSLVDYSKIIQKLDSMVNLNIEFLDQNKQTLPEWFVDMETADITYSSELLIKNFFLRLNPEERRKIFYIEPEICNPKAVYSSYYYEFMDNYLYEQISKFDSATTHGTMAINRLKRMKPYIDSLLNGKLKENYIAYKLSDAYLFSENIQDSKNIANFINSNFPDLTQEQLEFINSVKYKHLKTSLPNDSKAPDFYLKDVNDKFHRLSEFKGKVVYLNFWSLKYEGCIKEFPSINKLYSKMTGKPFEIINICLDGEVEKWKQIIEKQKLKGINLICKGKWEANLRRDYFIEEIPHFTLIDKESNVIENNTKIPENIGKDINAYFK